MLTCATAATSDYPAHTNFSNKSVTLTANSTGNQIVFVGASNAAVKYTVEYNGRSYSGGFVGTGWGKFYGINLPTETISKGSEISVKIDGNVNLNAAYIVDTQEYAVSTEITQKALFNNLKGVYLYPEQGALTNTKLVDGEVTLDAVGESITWYNLPTYKEIIVVYKAETAGTLKAYYGNNWKSSYAFPVKATNGGYQTVNLWLSSNLSTSTPTLAGQSLKIVFETGNVAATIKEVVLSYYFHAETGEVTNFGNNSSIFTPDTAARSDYPAYTAVYGNTALNLTVAQDTNKILIVATSQMEVEYVVNYNGFLFRKITPASNWNASGYGITEINTCLIPAGSTIIVTPLKSANITAIYAVNTIDYGYVGMPLEAKNAEMVGTELKVDDAVRLDTVGESLTWRNLPSYKSIAVVYRAEENGVISVNYNGKNYEMAVVNTLGAYQVAFAYVDTTTAGGFLTISYQKGNAAVAVQTVVLGGYSTGAECPAFASEPVWLGTGGGSSYPVYDNFNNTSLNVSLTKDGKALAFVCASASGNLLSFTFTIEGATYTKSVVGQGWDKFFIVYVETAPLASGTQITVQVGGNVNLNAVYAL